MNLPLLSLITFLPASGIFFLSLVHKNDENNAKIVGFWVSFVTFLLSLILWFNFDVYNAEYQFVEKHEWIRGYHVFYQLGVDGVSLYFVLLTTFLVPLCVLCSWKNIKSNLREYMIAFLLLETLIIGSFLALDLVLFYVFFEGTLIPLFLIIGIWGGDQRIYASFKFFLYTLLGSILMLFAIVKLYSECGTTDFLVLVDEKVPFSLQLWLWAAFSFCFAIKMPMWPFHTWLPDAHVQAPTAGSVILAGIILKMGGYGFIRFCLGLFPQACSFFAPLVMSLSVTAIVAMSLVALVQTDMKKLVAYASVAHMGFVTLGIFSMNLQGVSGAVLQMLSHGLISSALFLGVGMLYDRFHTREISLYSGLSQAVPVLSMLWMFFIFASLGVPGTSAFMGEFLVLLGAFQASPFFTTCAALGLVLGPAYALGLYKKIFTGKLTMPVYGGEAKPVQDANYAERLILVSLMVLVLWMGIYPKPFANVINRSVRTKILRTEAVQPLVLGPR